MRKFFRTAYCTIRADRKSPIKEEIDLPSGLAGIGDEAFFTCIALEKISLPDSLTKIGFLAFACCRLREVVLPDRLQQLDDGAFAWCEHLDKVEIPEKLLVRLQLDSVFEDTPFYKKHYEGVLQFLPDGSIEEEKGHAGQCV